MDPKNPSRKSKPKSRLILTYGTSIFDLDQESEDSSWSGMDIRRLLNRLRDRGFIRYRVLRGSENTVSNFTEKGNRVMIDLIHKFGECTIRELLLAMVNLDTNEPARGPPDRLINPRRGDLRF